MAAPCTDHLFLTGEKGVGKSTLIDYLLAGRTPCGFRTCRVEGVLSRPSVHLLTVPDATPAADNLLFYCGAYSPERFDTLGVAALENRSGDVLLMDEPTSALDPISTSKIEELATELKKNYTIVIVTHNMQQALRISDKTAFFLLGELIEYGDTQKLFYQPDKKCTEDYITGRFG